MKLIKLLLTPIVVMVLMCFVVREAQAATRTWDGGGGADTNWSTCTNWDGPDICPVAGDTVTFNATSTNNSTVDAGFGGSIGIVNINAGYTGTITLARSLTVTSTFTQSAGFFTASNQSLSIASTFTMNAGSDFTASSGTTTFTGAFTINGGTFHHNNGTVNFNGSQTLSCNNITFNLVTLLGGGFTSTVSSNCSLPLGDNPTVTSGVGLSGTLTGTGTLTSTSTGGTMLQVNAGGTLSGFSGLSMAGTTQVSGGTFNLSSLTTVIFNGALILNSGSITLPNGADLNSSLTINAGTFNAPAGTMTLAGSLTISGSPTFNANGGTVNFDGGTATLSCNNITFNLVTITHSNNTKTINSNCSLPLGSNPTIGAVGVGQSGQIILNGTLSGSGTLKTVSGGSPFTLNAGAALLGFTGLSVNSVTFSGATLDLSSYSTFSANSTVTLSSGSLTLPSGTSSFNGNFTHSGGALNAGNGTVVLIGTNQTITGINTFNNLTKNNTSAATLTFPSDTTTTVLGTLNLQGQNGALLSLRSSTTGTPWRIDAQGGRVLNSLDVKDSSNINSLVMVADSNSRDSGNNTNWSFGGQAGTPLTISFGLDYPSGGSHITSTQPTFRWSKAVVSNNSGITKYELYVDNGSTGDFYIDNILPSVLDQKTLDFGTYTLRDDGNYLNLTPRAYSLTTGKKNWRIVAHDSAGNTREESVDFYVDAVVTGPVLQSIPVYQSLPKPDQVPSGSPTPTPTSTPSPSSTLTGENLDTIITISSIKGLGAKIQILTIIPIVTAISVPVLAAIGFASNLGEIPFSGKLLTRFLQAIGFLPKGKPRGIIFEANSNSPVPFAIATVHDAKTGKVVDTIVSDSHGVFYDVKIPNGLYKIEVRHHLYNFPTSQRRPVILTYQDFYKGEAFIVNNQNQDWYLHIPMDSIEKKTHKSTSVITRERVVAYTNAIGSVLFYPSLFLSAFLFVVNMNLLNGVILGIYIAMLLNKQLKFSKPQVV